MAHCVTHNICICRYDFGTEQMPLILMSYCTPVAQGRSRIFYCLAGERGRVPRNVQRIVDLVPSWLKWLNHFERNDVLDGDNIFLHGVVSMSFLLLCNAMSSSTDISLLVLSSFVETSGN